VNTDGWGGYTHLDGVYDPTIITVIGKDTSKASVMFPRIHRSSRAGPACRPPSAPPAT
jgi:hypothetical protein